MKNLKIRGTLKSEYLKNTYLILTFEVDGIHSIPTYRFFINDKKDSTIFYETQSSKYLYIWEIIIDRLQKGKTPIQIFNLLERINL